MIFGFRSEDLMSDSALRYFPSQPNRKLSAALKTVSVFNGSSVPSGPTSRRLGLAPFVLRSWQDEQLRELSCDRRRSSNKRSPSLTFSGSVVGGLDMAVMGSSVPPDAGAGPEACADESCKQPNTTVKTAIVRRQRTLRTIPVSPSLGNCRKDVTQNISPNMWAER
jgi:hypothetical protein